MLAELAKAKIKLLEELLEYRPYYIGKDCPPIAYWKNEGPRRFIDEFDIKSFINEEEESIAQLQSPENSEQETK